MLDESKLINVQVKDNEVHVERKDPEQQLKKEFLPTSLEAQQRAAHARTKATTLGANIKREISMEIRNKLSESFDFIEESCGSGSPEFEFYAEPKMVSEGVEEGAPSYPIIGRASGVFAPIGVMSRNNRIYDNDHYDYLLENQQLVDRIAHRGMLGTIGHHDKKVDDQDLAEGKVSHIVTNLRIVEEADGSRNLYGTLEILDTPAGHLLKTYYDSGVPLFVSSRGGGNLLPVPNESYKRVDKTKYFLETFDIVKNPGFLQAKPVYEKVSESVEEIDEKVVVATKDHMDNVEADKLAKERAEDGKTGLVDCGEKVDLDGSMAAQKKRLEAKCNEETEDKLDKLIESVSSLVSAISEGDKKVVIKQEDGEKKETKETKEANTVNAKKDKPEDEENDDSESAVASSVTEEEKKQLPLFCSKEELINKLRSAIDETIEDTIDKTVKDENKKQKLLNKAMLNKHVELIHAADRRAEHFKGDPKYNTEKNQTFTQASPYNDAYDQINRNRENKNSYEDRKRQERGSDSDRIYNKIVKRANEIKSVTPQQKASAGKMNYMNKVHDKMNDKNSKIEQARKTIDEADQVLAQPIVAVQNAGNSTKSAQEANPEVKEPVTMDRLELARALKAKVNNDKKVEV